MVNRLDWMSVFSFIEGMFNRSGLKGIFTLKAGGSENESYSECIWSIDTLFVDRKIHLAKSIDQSFDPVAVSGGSIVTIGYS